MIPVTVRIAKLGEIQEVPAWDMDVPGLVVNKDSDFGWVITHLRSGHALNRSIPDLEAAVAAARALADVADWTLDGPTLRKLNIGDVAIRIQSDFGGVETPAPMGTGEDLS